jgi:choline dehydrogenase-like flavoprotein
VIAKASKLVVLSAGAFGSPTILERSGIGAKEVLDAVSVRQLVDLPGVGENYQGKFSLGSDRASSFTNNSQITISSLPRILRMMKLKRSTPGFEVKRKRWIVSGPFQCRGDAMLIWSGTECVALWAQEGKGLLAHKFVHLPPTTPMYLTIQQRLGCRRQTTTYCRRFSRTWSPIRKAMGGIFCERPRQTYHLDRSAFWVCWQFIIVSLLKELISISYLGDPSVATARKYYSLGYYTVRFGLECTQAMGLTHFI